MKRPDEDVLDDLLKPSKLAVKIPGSYDVPPNDSTTVGGTNRDSTVMPEMKANLGLVPYAMKQMGAKTLLRHHKITQAAKKNKDILDAEPMDFMEASELNDQIRKQQTWTILQKVAARDRAEEENKRKSKKRKLLAVAIVFIVVALIAVIGFATEIGGNDDSAEDEAEEEEDNEEREVEVENITLTEESFEVICENFGETFETSSLCLGTQALFCNDGVIDSLEGCDCVCEGKLALNLNCGSNNCTTTFTLEASINEDIDVIQSLVNFGNQCSSGTQDFESICLLDNLLFSCINSAVDVQICSQNCQTCEEPE